VVERLHRPRIVVIGDLLVDVVLAPAVELLAGTDVPGRVMLRQGGSATTTARWLGRGGARVSLIASVGRDVAGRALVRTIVEDGVAPHVARPAGRPTGRVGVFVSPGGERSFVQDRGAALWLAPEHLRPSWFTGADLVHVPAYSLLDHPLGDAGRRAADLGHEAGALVTVDLSSSAPLMAMSRGAAAAVIRGARPDLLFAAGSEAGAVAAAEEDLLALAPVVVLKRGAAGATLLWSEAAGTKRLHVQATPVEASDTTGAGDAFDAGFILGWLDARRRGRATAAALRAGAVAGNRTAGRHLRGPHLELRLG
jgi:ribokinase